MACHCDHNDTIEITAMGDSHRMRLCQNCNTTLPGEPIEDSVPLLVGEDHDRP